MDEILGRDIVIAMFKIRQALEKIPEHLVPYTTQQVATAYSYIDHSVWRFIMKIASDFFASTAHEKYLDGLRETGISIERIPLVSEMDAQLKKIGWRAVGVSGFIPPAVFLEFLALGIMPIATEIRKLENISYTPAPDIVHEAAGHAPIVADPDYNDYVRAYGEVAVKAIYSKKDLALYDAIKALSDVKEKPKSTEEEIEAAQKAFEKAAASVDYISESTQLSRMAWWTIEYGLVGDPNNFKLYGAGLLSSLSESYHCIDPNVVKVPLTVDCVNMGFDITRPQPQLFVATSFEEARKVLETYASSMAYRLGGVAGVAKARTAEATTTMQLEDGLQVSGAVKNFGVHDDSQITFIDLEGPLQLCEKEKEIPGFEMSRLPKNLRLVVGPLQENIRPEEGKSVTLVSKWGVKLEGKIEKIIKLANGKEVAWLKTSSGNALLSYSSKVTSVFGGPADRSVFIKATWDKAYASIPHVSTLTAEQKPLDELYGKVRRVRDDNLDIKKVYEIISELKKFPNDWLLRFEIVELAHMRNHSSPEIDALLKDLQALRAKDSAQQEIIDRGLNYLRK